MWVYQFQSEPCAPRTIFRVCSDEMTETEAQGEVSPVLEATMRVLMGFPEVYDLVLEEIRKLDGPGERAP